MSDPRQVATDSAPTDSAPVVEPAEAEVHDPLRLCIFATVALLGWLLGPFALLFFAGLGFVGYLRARRAGLSWSKCVLRDTRLVLGYLAVLVVAAALGIWLQLI